MSLLSGVVKIVDKVTKSLKFPCDVTIKRYSGPSTDGFGTKGYSKISIVPVILERKQRQVRTPNGSVTVSTATLTFLDVAALLAATPAVTLPTGETHVAGAVHVDDAIVLVDGSEQAILNVGGFVDSGTGNPVATEAYLG